MRLARPRPVSVRLAPDARAHSAKALRVAGATSLVSHLRNRPSAFARPSPISAATSLREREFIARLPSVHDSSLEQAVHSHTSRGVVAATALIVALLVEDGAVVSAAIGKGPLHLDVVHDAVRALDHQVVDIGRRLSLPWPSVVEKTSTSLAASDMKSSTA